MSTFNAAGVEFLVVDALLRKHLIDNKRMVGRLQDLADVEWLERERGGPPA